MTGSSFRRQLLDARARRVTEDPKHALALLRLRREDARLLLPPLAAPLRRIHACSRNGGSRQVSAWREVFLDEDFWDVLEYGAARAGGREGA